MVQISNTERRKIDAMLQSKFKQRFAKVTSHCADSLEVSFSSIQLKCVSVVNKSTIVEYKDITRFHSVREFEWRSVNLLGKF